MWCHSGGNVVVWPCSCILMFFLLHSPEDFLHCHRASKCHLGYDLLCWRLVTTSHGSETLGLGWWARVCEDVEPSVDEEDEPTAAEVKALGDWRYSAIRSAGELYLAISGHQACQQHSCPFCCRVSGGCSRSWGGVFVVPCWVLHAPDFKSSLTIFYIPSESTTLMFISLQTW